MIGGDFMKRTIRIAMSFCLASMLCMTAFAGAVSAAEVPMNTTAPYNGIQVSGTGTIEADPDMATVTLGVNSSGKDLEAIRVENATAMKKVMDAIQKLGIKSSEMSTSNISVYPEYDYSKDSSKITGYNIQNTLSITVLDINNVAKVVNAGMQAGANSLQGVYYDLRNSDAFYDKALEKAVKQAQHKAEVLAKVSGKKLGAIIQINESDSNRNIYPISATTGIMADAKLSGTSNIGDTLQPGKIKIQAQITILFAMQ